MNPELSIVVPDWFTYEANVHVDGGILHTSASGASPENAEINLRTQLVIDGWDPSDIEITIGDQRLDYGYRPMSSEEVAALEEARKQKDIEEAIEFLTNEGYEITKAEACLQ